MHNPWKMPIFIQAPAFLYLFVFSSIIIANNIKHILHVNETVATFMFLPTLISIGLLVCYITNASAGSPHLAYGYVRDFMMPFWLMGLAAGPWNLKRTQRTFTIFIPIVILVFLFIIANLKYGFLESFHISQINSSQLCDTFICKCDIYFTNPKGDIIHLPFDKTIIEQHCSNNNIITTETIMSYNSAFQHIQCNDKLSIFIQPILFGYSLSPIKPIIINVNVN